MVIHTDVNISSGWCFVVHQRRYVDHVTDLAPRAYDWRRWGVNVCDFSYLQRTFTSTEGMVLT